MISRYEVWLNGQALSEISQDILVLDIQYPALNYANSVIRSAKRQGARLYRRQVDENSVTVLFEIHAYDTRMRQEICNAVETWASKGGVLKTSDREGKQLHCVCKTHPAIRSARDWTEPLSIVFAAYALPFWQETIPATLTLSGTSGSGSLYVPGSIQDTFVEVEITANAALSQISLTAGNTSMTLSGLSVSSGQKIIISYDDEMIQQIRVGNTSLLNKRSGADDLRVDSGENSAFSFSSDASVSVTFKVRGLWA